MGFGGSEVVGEGASFGISVGTPGTGSIGDGNFLAVLVHVRVSSHRCGESVMLNAIVEQGRGNCGLRCNQRPTRPPDVELMRGRIRDRSSPLSNCFNR